MSTNVVSIRLPGELKDRLDALSEATGRPVAYYIRESITDHIGELEWAYGIAARAEAIRAGARETVPFDDVLADLGTTRDELSEPPSKAA